MKNRALGAALMPATSQTDVATRNIDERMKSAAPEEEAFRALQNEHAEYQSRMLHELLLALGETNRLLAVLLTRSDGG